MKDGRRDHQRFGWPFIASRDAAMSVYHFRVTLEALHRRIGCCPTLLPYFEQSYMRAARRMFDEYFGWSTKLRNAISHEAEHRKSPWHFKKATTKKAGAQQMAVFDSLMNRNYVTTHEGELLKIEITNDTQSKLVRIAESVFAAFRPIEVLMPGLVRRRGGR